MRVQHNVSLKEYNTFGINVKAKTFVSVSSIPELKEFLQHNYAEDLFILGGGSNMLLTSDIERTVIHIALKGKEIISEDAEEVIVKVYAGENWHQFVLWTIDHDFGGLENLSLIPGNVGTAPIQNIGAYGIELKDHFQSCKAINIQTLEERVFELQDIGFGYRDSVFKNELKGRYIITSVNFKLSKTNHRLNLDYGTIKQELQQNKIDAPSIKDVSEAVIRIRQSKLPDPRKIGNSGSFFKNPVIQKDFYDELKLKFPEMPSYPVSEDLVKVPAGWLIDQAGLKGFREGDAGVHKNQALVLVNYGNASGNDILELSQKVIDVVKQKYEIELEPEVNIIK